MKHVAALLLALLLLPACWRAGPEAMLGTTVATESTTEEPATAEPLPENCRLLKGEASHAIEYFADQVMWQRGDLTTLSREKTLHQRPPLLLMLDEATGEETVIATGMDSAAPRVQFVMDERYIVWTDNFKDNGYGGIYDTQRMVNILWGGCAFPKQLHDHALWLEATYFHYGGPLSLYRVALDGLERTDSLALGGNLLEAIPEADLDCRDLRWTALSPDCRYYAVRGAAIGIYVFDLQKKALVLQVPPGAIPGGPDEDPMPYLDFSDSKTLCCYGNSNEPDVIEAIMP